MNVLLAFKFVFVFSVISLGLQFPIICKTSTSQILELCDHVRHALHEHGLGNAPSFSENFPMENRNDIENTASNDIVQCDKINLYYSFSTKQDVIYAYRCNENHGLQVNGFHMMSFGNSTNIIFIFSGGLQGLFATSIYNKYYLYAQVKYDLGTV